MTTPAYHILVNPASASGRGRHVWLAAERILKEKGVRYRTVYSKSSAHIREVLTALHARNIQGGAAAGQALDTSPAGNVIIRLIVVGGDGTLDTAVDAIPDLSAVRLGVLPSGSGNDFARALGLGGAPQDLMLTILDDHVVRTIDVGEVTYHDYTLPDAPLVEDEFKTTHRFVVSAGIGFDAGVCAGVLQSRSRALLNRAGLGHMSYLLVALKELARSGKDRTALSLTIDESRTVHLDRTMFVAAMNTAYEGGGFMFGPDADPSDGKLDLCVVGNISIPKFLVGLPFAKKGKHFRFRGIDHHLAGTVDIRTDKPLWVHTDGETLTKASHITIRLLPEALQMLN